MIYSLHFLYTLLILFCQTLSSFVQYYTVNHSFLSFYYYLFNKCTDIYYTDAVLKNNHVPRPYTCSIHYDLHTIVFLILMTIT